MNEQSTNQETKPGFLKRNKRNIFFTLTAAAIITYGTIAAYTGLPPFSSSSKSESGLTLVDHHKAPDSSTFCVLPTPLEDIECTEPDSIDEVALTCPSSPSEFTPMYGAPELTTPNAPKVSKYHPPVKKKRAGSSTPSKTNIYTKPVDTNTYVNPSKVTSPVTIPDNSATKKGKSRLDRMLEYDHQCEPSGKCDDGGNIQ